MKTTITTIILIISFNLFSQKLLVKPPVVPFEPIKFANLNPDWILHIYDSTYIRTDTFDGRNVFSDIFTTGDHVRGERIYRCHAIRKYDYLGFRISCISIESGELIWTQNIKYEDYQRQHLPMHQTFDNEGNLIIIGFRKEFPYDPKEINWHTASKTPCKLFRLKINSEDGSIISYHSPSENPNYSYASLGYILAWSIFGIDANNNLEFLYEKSNTSPILNSEVQKGYINNMGQVVITDSLVYSQDNWDISRTRYAKRNGRYYCIESVANAVPIKYYFVEMDTALNELNRVDVSHFDFKSNYKEMSVYNENKIVFFQSFPTTSGYNTSYYTCDYSGQLLNVRTLKDDFFLKYYDATFIDEPKINKWLMLTIPKTNGNPTTKEIYRDVDVMHYDGQKYENYKTIKVDSDNQDFTPWRIVYLNDDYVIIDMYVGYLYYNNDSVPKLERARGNTTMALMKVSRKELGLEPSATQETTELAYTHCYPNPSSGAFYLDMDELEGKKDIRIFDMSGRNVYVEANVVRSDISLDLSDLPSGQYVYQVYIGSKVHAEGVWVKL